MIHAYYKNFIKKKISIFKNEVTNNLYSFKISENKCFSYDIIYFILSLELHELFQPIYPTWSMLIKKNYYKNFTEK